jgi:hypothetical protein
MGIYRNTDANLTGMNNIIKDLFRVKKLKHDADKEILIYVDTKRIFYSYKNQMNFLRIFIDKYKTGIQIEYTINKCRDADETYEFYKKFNDEEKEEMKQNK